MGIALKRLKTSLDGKSDQLTPQWIEVKISHLINTLIRQVSHVQNGGYECGYYVMHWMWSIFIGGFKNEWTMWFGEGTPLDMETITRNGQHTF
ncbi:hypothetical protein HKD37_08G023249 [Glycine soja]